jgi:hypothetical protein
LRAESTVKPVAPYELEFDGDWVDITFYQNIEQAEAEEGEAEKWQYDEYRLRVRNRHNLIASLNNSYDEWLAMAKAKEREMEPPTAEGRIDALESAILYLMME